MAQNDFLAYATGGGANVVSQATYAADAYVPIGRGSGILPSADYNKIARQGNYIAHIIAQLVVNRANLDMLDDGVDATKLANTLEMLQRSGDAHGQCYLGAVDATHVALLPQDGCRVKLNGVSRPLPSGGITVSNVGVFIGGVAGQNMVNGTLYDAFLFDNGGALALDFYSGIAAPVISDTTAGNVGVTVRSNGGVPDPTRTYVGKVYLGTGGQFGGQGLGSLSWFNRRAIEVISTGTGGATTASLAFVEINVASRVQVLAFPDDFTEFYCGGTVSNNTGGDGVKVDIGVDGATLGIVIGQVTSGIANEANGIFARGYKQLAHLAAGGVHVFNSYGSAVTGGTAQFTVVAGARLRG